MITILKNESATQEVKEVLSTNDLRLLAMKMQQATSIGQLGMIEAQLAFNNVKYEDLDFKKKLTEQVENKIKCYQVEVK